ncbi:hypothetical protein NLU13_5684 [Sarocladium strictum]|uniref:Autophagy-related protein 2 n=1 Tax=Sarocladium strictum TaxID=5046 RepID=A0AA39GJV7_SARSR|nr:hypothetical protein NLU13_5684 [Sarocladium strictum]
MATFFQSFRSSSMPKRLVRYALSRLDLLETETLDIDNLDLALGRNTVFEFRDVRIKLKKLEKLLQLPKSFSLDRARILLLRVTVPMDFYTSPIIIEVDGVDVRLQLLGPDGRAVSNPGSKTPEDTAIVPNTVDLAQSFLETQSPKERKELEEALAAETQDLGASLSVSDDGSEEDFPAGTGQALSLPTFMADFLQGIVDRMQVKIKGVTFQLDLKVLPDASSTVQEPISAQIALDSIDIEGVTTRINTGPNDASPVPKEGKRHIALHEVRACLISEANVFSALAQSASPSMASSPAMTRNPPSREATMETTQTPLERSTCSIRTTASAHLRGIDDDPFGADYPLGDSEEALAIPYDLSSDEYEIEGGSPPTPRASVYHDMGASFIEQSIFHSTNLSDLAASDPPGLGDDRPRLWESAQSESPFDRAMRTHSGLSDVLDESELTSEAVPGDEATSVEEAIPTSMSTSQSSANSEDLTLSHLYTHEEAESMYQSAFSNAELPSDDIPESTNIDPELSSAPSPQAEASLEPKQSMPGAWEEDSEETAVSTVLPVRSHSPQGDELEAQTTSHKSIGAEKDIDTMTEPDIARDPPSHERDEPDDIATPKGPTRLVKEILRMRTLSLYVPTSHQHIQVHAASPESVAQLAESLERSCQPQAPGAFSVHLAPRRKSSSSESSDASDPKQDPVDRALEVSLSPVTLSFDASLGFLLAMVVGKLMDAVKRDTTEPARTTPSSSKSSESTTALDVQLTLQELSINFLNRLGGVADTSERYLDPSAFSFNHEVLLNMALQNLNISSSPATPKPANRARSQVKGDNTGITKIEIEKFRFGYANGDIISFDGGKPMSTSVRDTFLTSGHDIGIKILPTASGIRTDIETLPLVINVDLQRLDETFSWFGGLSSFLNMSTSMTSTPSPAKDLAAPVSKPRGVRFETPLDPRDKSAAASNKVNVRIGGAAIEVFGRECSILAESSAVKIVSRAEGLGVAITMLRVSGPYLTNSMADPAITTEVGGVRLDFLTTPREADLDRLVELIVPSKAKFDRNNDELMLDTLLRQRRKGSVLKIAVETVKTRVSNVAELVVLPNLAEELNKLSTVAKYLPEDDRPGLLTLGSIQKINVSLRLDNELGLFEGEIKDLGVAQITVPSLIAVAVHDVRLKRNKTEELINTSNLETGPSTRDPVIMARMIGDEIEPVIKLKLQNLEIEYRVSTVMDVLGLGADATPQDFEDSLAASIANLGEQAHSVLAREPASPTVAAAKAKQARPLTLDVEFRDCVLGLNPHQSPARLAVVLLDAHLSVDLPEDVETRAALDINKASILLVDDASQTRSGGAHARNARRASASTSRQVVHLCSLGYVEVCFTSSAKALVNVKAGADGEKHIEVELRDDLLVLETCADSTQTLITVANALKPPTPPSKENKFRTKVMPVQDLLASISAEAFGRPEGEYDFDQDFAGAQEMAGAGSGSDFDDSSDNSLRIESQFYGHEEQGEELFDATKASGISEVPSMQDTQEGVLLTGFTKTSSGDSSPGEDLVIHDNFFGTAAAPEDDRVAKVWNSNKNTYDKAPANLIKRSPLRVSVRDVHLIWNLFDGYDWEHTRDVISQAVQEVEAKAIERQARTGPGVYEEEIEDEETIGDFLFNSIYIGIPANRDPQELSRAINEGLHDNATETESIAATTITASTNRTARPSGPKPKRLRLQRSRRHKITFELSGVDIDMLAFPPDYGETLSSVDIRVKNLDIFDHVPTSTWKKFATYDQDAGEREMGTSMIHLELLNVKPLPELGASEMVVRVTILPLRLHVDQDALDFITRFFEFKDEKTPVHASPSDVPFVQRAEVNDVPVKLDFKPKRVDYAGLRSGHTTEFMNFIVLEEARMVLRHVIIYGVSGFDRLGKTLNDIWTPDVRNNQLPGVIAGLAPVRSLVNIGSGFRDLVEIPLKEYQKDGRVFRSISKGAVAFARTTGTEIVKLGAKLAVGTQYALQGAEGLLSEAGQNPGAAPWDDEDLDEEERKQISLYADQPTGVIQGLRGGYRSLTRDVNLARDAIIAVPGEVMQSQGPGGAARAVWRKAPTIIFRPAMGVTKVIGQTLMGATNTMDPQNRRRIDEKYKKH